VRALKREELRVEAGQLTHLGKHMRGLRITCAGK
jgi:hypothetical protein